jgi:hypothetical protein
LLNDLLQVAKRILNGRLVDVQSMLRELERDGTTSVRRRSPASG